MITAASSVQKPNIRRRAFITQHFSGPYRSVGPVSVSVCPINNFWPKYFAYTGQGYSQGSRSLGGSVHLTAMDAVG